MRKNQIFLMLILIIGFLILPLGFLAAEGEALGVDIYQFDFPENFTVKGHTFELLDQNFRLGIFPKVLSAPTQIVIKRRLASIENMPDGFEALSDSWEFDLKDKKSYNNKSPLIVELKYSPSINWKSIYYWTGSEWRAIPSVVVDHEKGIIRTKLNFSYARLMVLSDKTKMSEGVASWYRYKGCGCAASPDYPKGTLLKVTNLDNKKSVVVKVNDFGPDRVIFPDRVIDLDVTAYKQIAKKGSGVCDVIVEPIIKR